MVAIALAALLAKKFWWEAHLHQWSPLPRSAWPAFFGAVIIMLFGVFFVLRELGPNRWLGDLELSVEPDAPFPGEEIHCRLRLVPCRDIRIQPVRVTLAGTEEVCTLKPEAPSSGGKREKHELHRAEQVMTGPEAAELRAHEEQVFEASFVIPSGCRLHLPRQGPPSRLAGDRRAGRGGRFWMETRASPARAAARRGGRLPTARRAGQQLEPLARKL